jgi:hypothetical protein
MKRRSRLSLFVLGAVTIALSACDAAPAPGDISTTSAAFILPSTRVKGFVGSDQLTGSFDANPFLSFNSTDPFETHSHNHVTQLATGSYRVDFPGLAAEFGGNAQVTLWDPNATIRGRCKIQRWLPSGTTLQLFVRCFDIANNPINTRFLASYVRRNDLPGQEGGYVWANDPSNGFYTPSTTFQWNSTGSDVTIQRSSPGVYTVFFPGQNFTGGTVEVSAYGDDTNFCKVGAWFQGTSAQNVIVRCFDNSGAPSDSMFSARFTRGSPSDTPSFGFAWADQDTIPLDSSANVSSTFSRAFVATCPGGHESGPVRETHIFNGQYGVDFNMQATGNSLNHHPNVKVTAYGNTTSAISCEVVGNMVVGGGFAQVLCFSTNGAIVTSKFTMTYSDSSSTTGC